MAAAVPLPTVLARPQVADFCCDTNEGAARPVCGSILNDPQDTLTPAFAAEYSQARCCRERQPVPGTVCQQLPNCATSITCLP